MKNYLIQFLMLASFASCEGPGESVTADNLALIQFFDREGHNILLKENSEFEFDDLRLFYYNRENEYVMRHKASADNPYFISFDYGLATIYNVIGDEDGNIIMGEKYATYLDFGNGDIDTIQAAGFKTHGRTEVTNIWYNGKQVLNNGTPVQPFDVELPGSAFSAIK